MSSFSGDALRGRVALVTGAASGIGRATALALAGAGAAVALVDQAKEGLEETQGAIVGAGGVAQSFTADLADAGGIAPLVDEVVDALGVPYVLVNVAGVSGQVWSIEDTSEETWDLVHAVNLKAPFLLTKHVAARMVAGGGGRIVNITSSAAFTGLSPIAYSSSKAALVQLTRVAATEYGPGDVNVNAVAPGLTRTPMTVGRGVGEDFDRHAKEGPLANLLGRPSEPEDIANVIVFLCLPESRQITGQTIHVSAGNVV